MYLLDYYCIAGQVRSWGTNVKLTTDSDFLAILYQPSSYMYTTCIPNLMHVFIAVLFSLVFL